MLFNIIFHQIRIGGGNQNLSFVKIRLRIADHHGSVQGIQNVGVLGAGLGNNAAVIKIHVGFGNIADGDNTLEDAVVVDAGKRHHVILLHQAPGIS